MNSGIHNSPSGLLSSFSMWMSQREKLPVAIRATLRFYARSNTFDFTALRIRRLVEETVEGFLSDCNSAIAEEIETELGYDSVSFSYETKLTLPVELTLAYVYRQAIDESSDNYNPVTNKSSNPLGDLFRIPFNKNHKGQRTERLRTETTNAVELVQRAESVARLCTEALLDGDMQDAINDQEYDDFIIDKQVGDEELRDIAHIAQSCLHERVNELFSEFPPAVQEHYDWAVERSNHHQATDEEFRDLLARAREGDDTAIEEIETRYKHASIEEPRTILTTTEQNLPYSKSQYERVGVIYAGMIEMFKAAEIPIDDSFKRSVILSIIGAQIWLDDIDDYDADVTEGQLTPVTAEYTIADTKEIAYQNIVSITESYLEHAIMCALESGSHITAIATEYIYLAGTPEKLPGAQ